MPRRILKRYLPDRKVLNRYRCLRIFGSLLHSPRLWHIGRRSAARSMAIGLFCAFMPVPFQMALAAVGALLLGANLPLALVLVWVTNPITMAPIFFGAYKLGTLITGVDPVHTASVFSFPPRLTMLWAIGRPLGVGCLVAGLVSGLLGYMGMRLLWRLMVTYQWRRRCRHRDTTPGGSAPPSARSPSTGDAFSLSAGSGVGCQD